MKSLLRYSEQRKFAGLKLQAIGVDGGARLRWELLQGAGPFYITSNKFQWEEICRDKESISKYFPFFQFRARERKTNSLYEKGKGALFFRCPANFSLSEVDHHIPSNLRSTLEMVTRYQISIFPSGCLLLWGAFDSAINHKRQRRKHQSVTAKRGKLQTPKFV